MCLPSHTASHLNFNITYERSVVFQKKKARAELLFCQLDLLFSNVLLAVAVVVC